MIKLNDLLWTELTQLFSVVCQIDKSGGIVRASHLLTKRCNLGVDSPQIFFETFKFKRPTGIDGSYQSLQGAVGQLFLGASETHQFAIRGQMISLEKHGIEGMCFVGVPWLWWIQSNSKPANVALTLADFPVHDVQMDQLLFMSTQQAMVDDLQMLNKELETAKKTLEENTRVKQDFFHHVSHEMRTPLNGVISALALTPKDNLPIKTAELLGLAASSADRLLEVVNFTLETASAEAGFGVDSCEEFDLNQVLTEAISVIRAQALDKGIDLVYERDESRVVSYRGQAQLLRQVVTNLLSNALKFTEQGAIVLRVDQGIDSRKDFDRLNISVQDSGIGIPASAYEAIFEPFIKSVTPGFKSANGTGLGLNIVKRYVEMMGGEIALQSVLGEGSRFNVDIAFERGDPAKQIGLGSTPVLEHHGKLRGHVLLVDDIETNLSLNAEVLGRLGLAVDIADTGEEAVALVTANPNTYQLILMDLEMPGIDGFEAARRILVDPACSSVLIVALTAFTGEAQRQKALAAGMVGFISKPVSQAQFVEYLSPWLSVDAAAGLDEQPGEVAVDEVIKDFDIQVFSRLADQVGVDTTGKLVDKFLTESAGRWEALRSAISAGNMPVAAREAHTLGSACLSFGLISSGNAFRKIESDVNGRRAPSLSDLDMIVPGLFSGIESLEQTVTALRVPDNAFR